MVFQLLMMDEKAKIYSFGEFQLVLEDRTLLRGGEPVALQPKCFDTPGVSGGKQRAGA